MNDLLQAAKAVIGPDNYDLSYLALSNLRAAVERAVSDRDDDLYAVCLYGARTERERIKNIVKAISVQGNHNEWFDCCDTILEKIDDN